MKTKLLTSPLYLASLSTEILIKYFFPFTLVRVTWKEFLSGLSPQSRSPQSRSHEHIQILYMQWGEFAISPSLHWRFLLLHEDVVLDITHFFSFALASNVFW